MPDATIQAAGADGVWYSFAVGSYDYGPISATITAKPAATIDISSSSGIFSSRINYYAGIDGPNEGPVPVELSFVLDGTASGAADALASLKVYKNDDTGRLLASIAINTANSATGTQDFAGTLHFTVIPGEQLFISLSATASSSGGTANVFADPRLSIDPVYAIVDPNFASDYAVQTSPQIGNALATDAPPPAPEPATWAMMLVGIGGIGGALRIGRRKAAAAVA